MRAARTIMIKEDVLLHQSESISGAKASQRKIMDRGD